MICEAKLVISASRKAPISRLPISNGVKSAISCAKTTASSGVPQDAVFDVFDEVTLSVMTCL